MDIKDTLTDMVSDKVSDMTDGVMDKVEGAAAMVGLDDELEAVVDKAEDMTGLDLDGEEEEAEDEDEDA